jgi:exopolyphosphatase / guanosine-5'-triphosphate,3'-diphosphate pyrophosphatase
MDGRSTESRSDDAGPFGRRLFQDDDLSALSRVGIVDVGSNSVRLVVFDGAARSPAYFYNEKILCGLGLGLGETGRLNPEGRVRALAALRRFQLLAEGMGIAPLSAVATAAVREAEDGPDFIAQVKRETGMQLFVIPGEEEARLSAQGVLLGWPDADGLVCDIGGSSMELAEVHLGKVGKRVSTPLGPQKLLSFKGDRRDLRKHIAEILDPIVGKIGRGNDHIYLVGGSWRAIARIDMHRRGYPLTVLHEYRMTPDDVAATVKFIDGRDMTKLGAEIGTSEARMELIPIAAEVLGVLVPTFKPADIAISSYGIREGMLFEQMPARLRRLDPLLEACRFAESRDARIPGFGAELYDFILPLFPEATKAQKRIIEAACLLHDVSWRSHPDYRHEVCFENATRANLGGLTHQERVFLGLALLHRYKNSRDGSKYEPLFALLDPAAIRLAETVGKAMRFGAMFAIDSPLKGGRFSFDAKAKSVTLTLTKRGRGLFGEVAEARLKSLANSLGSVVNVV